MAKPYLWLIIVWSLVCASGLAIYLYQFFNPIIPVPGQQVGDLAAPLAYWAIVWTVPVVILALQGRRR